MRHLLLYLILSVPFYSSFSQNTGIGVGTTNPHPSAELEVNSTNKGFLPPRMTFNQRNSISNPAQGLIIYCIDCDSSGQAQIYNGTKWTNLLGGAALNPLPANLPSVTIGTQIWQSKNLDVATYRNGDPIPQVTDPIQWENLTTGAWCWYNNDSATYGPIYGRLYNWYAVNDPRSLAPEGWHIPSYNEWIILANNFGGIGVSGGALKESGTAHWLAPNNGATNISGFTALPGGCRFQGVFNGLGSGGSWWHSSEFSTLTAWNTYISSSMMDPNQIEKQSGFSVRCIKN